ncbi:hypothetical protein KIPB_002086 [Kipferlia bialata]|uniref:Uncharacterized protein n=1 Tax=Kipferlia bialata TaxID=797122 RepID=A0A9K3CR94_9EUKA|nr:hypothetical protein KIPB_002086 [Kipferlia bialata]|eukprot:g2086.t1
MPLLPTALVLASLFCAALTQGPVYSENVTTLYTPQGFFHSGANLVTPQTWIVYPGSDVSHVSLDLVMDIREDDSLSLCLAHCSTSDGITTTSSPEEIDIDTSSPSLSLFLSLDHGYETADALNCWTMTHVPSETGRDHSEAAFSASYTSSVASRSTDVEGSLSGSVGHDVMSYVSSVVAGEAYHGVLTGSETIIQSTVVVDLDSLSANFEAPKADPTKNCVYAFVPGDGVTLASVYLHNTYLNYATGVDDFVSVFVAHCVDGQVNLESGIKVFEYATNSSVYNQAYLTFDVEQSPTNMNCWYMEHYIQAGSNYYSPPLKISFIAQQYVAEPTQRVTRQPTGTLSPKSYYNDQSVLWVIASDSMAYVTLTCSGTAGSGDLLSVSTGSWDGSEVSDVVEQWTQTGALSTNVVSFPTYKDTNCVTVLWTTDRDFLGGSTIACSYSTDSYTQEYNTQSAQSGTFGVGSGCDGRYEPFMLDTYIINPPTVQHDSCSIYVSGAFYSEGTELRLFSGWCEGDIVVGDSVLVDSAFIGIVDIREVFIFDGVAPSTHQDATHCLFLEVQSGLETGPFDYVSITYELETYTTVTLVTDPVGTLSNDRYQANQNDTVVVNAGPDVASVSVTVTPKYAETDSLSLYVAHCDADQPSSTTNTILIASEFDQTSTYLLALDVHSTSPDAVSCWYLEFTTTDADASQTHMGYSADYTCTPHVKVDPIQYLTDETGTIANTNYNSNQDKTWVITGPSLAHALFSCSGEVASTDSLIVSTAAFDGIGVVTNSSTEVQTLTATFSVDLDVTFASYEDTNCITMEFVTADTHLGGTGFTCDYTVDQFTTSDSVETDDAGSFTLGRYVPYMLDTYVINPSIENPNLGTISITGSIDAETATLRLFTGWCEGGTVVGDSLLVDSATNGSVDVSEAFTFDYVSEAPSNVAVPCMYVELQTTYVAGHFYPIDVVYEMESYNTVTLVTSLAGTVSNSRYLANQDDVVVVNAGSIVASVAITVTSQLRETDHLSLYVAHCDAADPDVTSGDVLISGAFDQTTTYNLALDVASDALDAVNCWYTEFETVGADISLESSGYSVDYISTVYEEQDPVQYLTDAAGTIANSNYYSSQDSSWVITGTAIAHGLLSCSGQLGTDDSVTISTATYDGEIVVSNREVQVLTGDFSVDVDVLFATYEDTNCITVHFVTSNNYLGGAGFSCRYKTDSFTSKDFSETDATGAFSIDRLVPYMLDTYVINPSIVEKDTCSLVFTGNIDTYTTELKVFTGWYQEGVVVGRSSLQASVSAGAVYSTVTIAIDTPAPASNPEAKPCVYFQVQTGSTTSDTTKLHVSYDTTPYYMRTLVTDIAGTFSNDRYLTNQDDTVVVNAGPDVASVLVTVTPMYAATDFLSLYVAHCDADRPDSTSHAALIASEFDQTNSYTLALDVEGTSPYSINCWYLEFVTADADATLSNLGYSVDYTADSYVFTRPVEYLTDATGTITNSNYYSNQDSTWVITGEDIAHGVLSCSGQLAKSDSVTISAATVDGQDVVYNSMKEVECLTGDFSEDVDVVFPTYQDTNCITVEFVTSSSYLGGAGFTCAYTTDSFTEKVHLENTPAGSFSIDRYVPFMLDTYIINPSIENADEGCVTISGDIDAYTAELRLYTGWCEGKNIIASSYPVDTVSDGIVSISETITFVEADAPPTSHAMRCIYIEIQTQEEVGDFDPVEVSYTMESHTTVTLVTDLVGTISNDLYPANRNNIVVVNPGDSVASVSLTVTPLYAESDSLSLYVAHCGAGEPDSTSGAVLIASEFDDVTMYTLTFDVLSESTDAVNCWYIEYQTADTASLSGDKAYSVDYTSVEYVKEDPVQYLTDVTGTITNTNYYSNEDTTWVITGSAMAYAVLSCSGHLAQGDSVTISTGSYDGVSVVTNSESKVQALTGDFTVDVDVLFATYADTNCITLHFATSDTYIGAAGFSCDYTVEPYTVKDHVETEAIGSFSLDRCVPFMQDKYIINPNMKAVDQGNIDISGFIDADTSYLRLYTGWCEGDTVVGNSVLHQSVSKGNVNVSESFTLSDSAPASNPNALPCMYIELQTGDITGTGNSIEVSYSMLAYTTTTLVTDLNGTVSSGRYLANQDDTVVVNAGTKVATVLVTVTAKYAARDSLTLYVAHCDADQPDATSKAILVANDFSQTSSYTLAFDVESDSSAAINCWYLEFQTADADPTQSSNGYSADYTSTIYVEDDAVQYLSSQTGTIANSNYYSQDGTWVITGSAIAHGLLSCTGELAEDASITVSSASYDGISVVTNSSTEVQTLTGSFTEDVDVSFPTYADTNCITVQFATPDSYVGGTGFSCDYAIDAFFAKIHVATDTSGSFSIDRYIPYMLDTYVINPGVSDPDLGTISLSGTIDANSAELRLYTGWCEGKDSNVVGTSYLEDTVTNGDVDISESFTFDDPAPASSHDAMPCMYIEIQTGGQTGEARARVACNYTIVAPVHTWLLVVVGVLILSIVVSVVVVCCRKRTKAKSGYSVLGQQSPNAVKGQPCPVPQEYQTIQDEHNGKVDMTAVPVEVQSMESPDEAEVWRGGREFVPNF